jgi:hypothetical protein
MIAPDCDCIHLHGEDDVGHLPFVIFIVIIVERLLVEINRLKLVSVYGTPPLTSSSGGRR